MRTPRSYQTQTDAAGGNGRSPRLAAWAFVYIFFTNGTPFDAPNRSETCPASAR